MAMYVCWEIEMLFLSSDARISLNMVVVANDTSR